MLSDHEQRELDLIEQALAAEDRRFDRALRGRGAAGRCWPVRAAVSFGIFMVVIGSLVGGGGLILQGLLISGGGVVWLRWLRPLVAARAARREFAPPTSPPPTSPPPESCGPV